MFTRKEGGAETSNTERITYLPSQGSCGGPPFDIDGCIPVTFFERASDLRTQHSTLRAFVGGRRRQVGVI